MAIRMSHVPASVRARALTGAGNLAYLQSDYAGARAWHEESLALRRGIGDKGRNWATGKGLPVHSTI